MEQGIGAVFGVGGVGGGGGRIHSGGSDRGGLRAGGAEGGGGGGEGERVHNEVCRHGNGLRAGEAARESEAFIRTASP